MKTHAITATASFPFCGRMGKVRMSAVMDRVDCQRCRNTPEFEAEQINQRMDREAAIDASPARKVHNSWDWKNFITCRECGHDEFKDAGRSLDTFNHKCAKCGTMNHTMTETGMSA